MKRCIFVIFFLGLFCHCESEKEVLTKEERWLKGRCKEVECTKKVLGGVCINGMLAGGSFAPSQAIRAKGIQCTQMAEKEAEMSPAEYEAVAFEFTKKCFSGDKKACIASCCEGDLKDENKSSSNNKKCSLQEIQCLAIKKLKEEGFKIINEAAIQHVVIGIDDKEKGKFSEPIIGGKTKKCIIFAERDDILDSVPYVEQTQIKIARSCGWEPIEYVMEISDLKRRCLKGEEKAQNILSLENCLEERIILTETTKICGEEKEDLEKKIEEEITTLNSLLDQSDTISKKISLGICPFSTETLFRPNFIESQGVTKDDLYETIEGACSKGHLGLSCQRKTWIGGGSVTAINLCQNLQGTNYYGSVKELEAIGFDPGITVYWDFSNCKDKAKILKPEYQTFLCSLEEEKYWNLALAILAYELLNYEEINISEDEAADLLGKLATISSLKAPDQVQVDASFAFSKTVMTSSKLEVESWVGQLSISAKPKEILKGSGTALSLIGHTINAAEGINEHNKKEIFAKIIKEAGIIGCLSEYVDQCFSSSPPQGLKKAIEEGKVLDDYLEKADADFKYQMFKVGIQILTTLKGGSILAAAGITAASVGGSGVIVAGLLLAAGVDILLTAPKENENSIFYYRVASLFYTLAEKLSSLNPECLFLKAEAIHSANSLMRKYVVGKIFGQARGGIGLFPKEEETKWEDYLADYFGYIRLGFFTFGGQKGKLAFSMEDFVQCLEKNNQEKICISSPNLSP